MGDELGIGFFKRIKIHFIQHELTLPRFIAHFFNSIYELDSLKRKL